MGVLASLTFSSIKDNIKEVVALIVNPRKALQNYYDFDVFESVLPRIFAISTISFFLGLVVEIFNNDPEGLDIAFPWIYSMFILSAINFCAYYFLTKIINFITPKIGADDCSYNMQKNICASLLAITALAPIYNLKSTAVFEMVKSILQIYQILWIFFFGYVALIEIMRADPTKAKKVFYVGLGFVVLGYFTHILQFFRSF